MFFIVDNCFKTQRHNVDVICVYELTFSSLHLIRQ